MRYTRDWSRPLGCQGADHHLFPDRLPYSPREVGSEWEFPKIRVPYIGVLIIRILQFRVLHEGERVSLSPRLYNLERSPRVGCARGSGRLLVPPGPPGPRPEDPPPLQRAGPGPSWRLRASGCKNVPARHPPHPSAEPSKKCCAGGENCLARKHHLSHTSGG